MEVEFNSGVERGRKDSPPVYLAQRTHKRWEYCIRSLYAVGTTFVTSNFRNVADSVVRCENFPTTRKLDTENMAFLLTAGGLGELINFTCKSQLNRHRPIRIYTRTYKYIDTRTHTHIRKYTHLLCMYGYCVCVYSHYFYRSRIYIYVPVQRHFSVYICTRSHLSVVKSFKSRLVYSFGIIYLYTYISIYILIYSYILQNDYDCLKIKVSKRFVLNRGWNTI